LKINPLKNYLFALQFFLLASFKKPAIVLFFLPLSLTGCRNITVFCRLKVGISRLLVIVQVGNSGFLCFSLASLKVSAVDMFV